MKHQFSSRGRSLIAMTVFLAALVTMGVGWFLLFTDIANDQRMILEDIYMPTVQIAMKKSSGVMVKDDLVRHGNCRQWLGERCIQFVFTQKIQQDPVQLKALLDAATQPCLVLKSADALSILEQYQLERFIRRERYKTSKSSTDELQLGAAKAAKAELERAQILANIGDSCGHRSSGRQGLILQLDFEGYGGAGTTKFVSMIH